MKIPSTRLTFYFWVIVILLSFNSCSDSKGTIILDQTTSFKTPENSSPMKVIQADVDFYQNLTLQKSANNLVLYKLIRGSNYLLYVGIGLNIPLEEMGLQVIANPKFKLIDQKTTSPNSKSIFLQMDSLRFCYHYLKQLQQGDKYLFSIITTNKVLAENMYKSDFIEKYFISE